MKTTAKFLSLLSAAVVAFVTPLSAQIETFQSQTGYAGNTETFASLQQKTQVFTDVIAITSLTYNFFAGSGGGGATTGTVLSAAFGEWNGTSIDTLSLIDLGTFAIGASGTGVSPGAGWTNVLSYQDEFNESVTTGAFLNASYTFDFTQVLGMSPDYGFFTDPSKTYALTLSYVSGDANLALGSNTNSTAFVNGYQYPYNPDIFPAPFKNYDYVFSAMSIVPVGNTAIIPETSTVASILGALFVAGLAGHRVRQRRQLAPIAAAA